MVFIHPVPFRRDGRFARVPPQALMISAAESRKGDRKNRIRIASIEIDAANQGMGSRTRASDRATLSFMVAGAYTLPLSACFADMVNNPPGAAGA